MASDFVCTFTRLTASGIVGDSGAKVDIFGYSVDAAGTAATPVFKHGTLATSPGAFAAQTTPANQSSVQSLPLPVRLVNGCYVSFDANTTAVSVFWGES